MLRVPSSFFRPTPWADRARTELFLSPCTVAYHLYKAYPKLCIRTLRLTAYPGSGSAAPSASTASSTRR